VGGAEIEEDIKKEIYLEAVLKLSARN